MSKKYVVQPGDTLQGIAARVYADCSTYTRRVAYAERIYKANLRAIATPGTLVPGTTLHIP